MRYKGEYYSESDLRSQIILEDSIRICLKLWHNKTCRLLSTLSQFGKEKTKEIRKELTQSFR
jgi:hypothetical protein